MGSYKIISYFGRLLPDKYVNLTVFLGKLQRIREQVQKYLVQTNIITVHVFRDHITDINIKKLVSRLYLRLYNINNIIHRLAQ